MVSVRIFLLFTDLKSENPKNLNKKNNLAFNKDIFNIY